MLLLTTNSCPPALREDIDWTGLISTGLVKVEPLHLLTSFLNAIATHTHMTQEDLLLHLVIQFLLFHLEIYQELLMYGGAALDIE